MYARLSGGPNTTLLAQLADGDTSLRRHTWVLSAYLLLGLILTWPLVAHLATHVPGDGIDDPSLAWNLWWVKHALVDLPQNPFISAWQFWPIGINLAFYTLTVLNGMLGVPLVSAFGVIPAYNLLLLSSFVLGGFGAYLLCLEFVGRGSKETSRQGDKEDRKRLLSPCLFVSVSAFLAGALYAFASSKLFYAALGQGNIASSQWVPFAALYIVRTARPGWQSARCRAGGAVPGASGVCGDDLRLVPAGVRRAGVCLGRCDPPTTAAGPSGRHRHTLRVASSRIT